MSYNLVNPTTGDLTRVAGGTLYADNPIGSIIPFGSSIIPSGYLLCNGQAVSRTTYSELFAAIGTAFGTGDGSTTFNLPDMRESVPKGAGETGQTVGAHVKSGGLAVGEFLDDRVQKHTHLMGVMQSSLENGTSYSKAVINEANLPLITMENSGRKGDTTEVKSVGVNYIIKAKHVGIPADFIDAIDDAISDTTVDTVENGNMNPVTSNAVYDKLNGTDVTGLTVDSHINSYTVTKTGNLVIISVVVDFTGATTGTDINLIMGLPKNIPYLQSISVPNEYGLTGTATFRIEGNGTKLLGRCSAANAYYYAQLVYITN